MNSYETIKLLYPNASEEELQQRMLQTEKTPAQMSTLIQPIARQSVVSPSIQGRAASSIPQMPSSSDSDKLIAEIGAVETPTDKPDINSYLKQKYGLDDKYSDAARQAILDQNKEDASGINWRAGLASLGAGIAGKDAASAGMGVLNKQQSERDSKINEFDKASQKQRADIAFNREEQNIAESKDPMSERSKAAQNMLVQDYGMSPEVASKMTAEQVEARLPGLKQKLDREMKEREFSEKQKDRQLQREQMNANRQSVRDDKQAVRDEKKKTTLNEVEDRRRNIEDNVTTLENMIKDKGTYEAFGSHNADMERLVDQIATDMAKLTDPNSVARPSEVEMFKKGLVSPTATGMRNSTALDILKNFRGEVNKRTENAYKIRGIDNPGSQQAQEETKTVNGRKYKKVPGGWEEVG